VDKQTGMLTRLLQVLAAAIVNRITQDHHLNADEADFGSIRHFFD